MIIYKDNWADFGSVPKDNHDYQSGETVTVRGNTGSLALDEAVFMGWYTDSDFPASFVREGQTFTMGYDNVILYAIWTGNPTWSVTYNANGETNGDIPADSTEY